MPSSPPSTPPTPPTPPPPLHNSPLPPAALPPAVPGVANALNQAITIIRAVMIIGRLIPVIAFLLVLATAFLAAYSFSQNNAVAGIVQSAFAIGGFVFFAQLVHRPKRRHVASLHRSRQRAQRGLGEPGESAGPAEAT